MSVRDILAELLPLEADDRGVAAVSVVEQRGADPISIWTPELERPPRFSITKTFTAVLILRLCEDGRLQLTDPRSDVLSGSPRK
ncbi:MAG TPA: serine hydrolase [Gemmatimonadaceae bacterium]|nr:serine hydrolase [Gemmatimonadaceae bacterium]